MNDMGLPNENVQRLNITIPVDSSYGPIEIHIDYFDKEELIMALKDGIKSTGLEHRIFITACRPILEHEPSEWTK